VDYARLNLLSGGASFAMTLSRLPVLGIHGYIQTGLAASLCTSDKNPF
jgi:hypothetical protein